MAGGGGCGETQLNSEVATLSCREVLTCSGFAGSPGSTIKTVGFRELDSWAGGADTGAESKVVGSGPVLGASGPETGGASLESGGTMLSQMLEEGAGNCTVLFVAAGFELFILFVVVIVVVLLLRLFPLLFVSLILILALLDKGLNRLDFITTVRGGREAEEAAISAPFTGDTRTIRMAPP